MLKATDLTKSHDGAPLFDGLSLTLDDGARAALVGVNGVGKTTLLRLLAGVDRPDRGAVALGRARSRRLPAAGRARPGRARSTTSYATRWARCGRCGSSSTRSRPTCTTSTRTAARRSASRRSAAGRWRRGWTRRGAGSTSSTWTAGRGSATCPAARPRAACWPPCCSASRPSCCSTSRPTTSTPTAASGWGSGSPTYPGTLLTISHDRDFLDATVQRIYELSRGRPRGLRGRLHRLPRGARAAPRTPRAGDRGAGQVPAPARGRHRDDVAPGAVHRAHRAARDRAEVQALREEGGEEVQGARAPAAARDGLAGLAARAARPGRVQGPARQRRTAGGG